MSHIYGNPVEAGVDLVARILSLWTNIHKQTRQLCEGTWRT